MKEKQIEVLTKWEQVGDDIILLLRSFDGGKSWEYFKTAHTEPPCVVMADSLDLIIR